MGWLLALSLTAVSLAACMRPVRRQNGPRVSSVRTVKPFDRIVIEAGCDVHYVQGDRPEVKIVGPEQTVKGIVTRCAGSVLTLQQTARWRFFSMGNEAKVEVWVTSPDLTAVALKGSGGFSAAGGIDTDTLTVSLSGSGDIRLKSVICDVMNVSLRGSGDIGIGALQCAASDFRLYGSGDVSVRQSGVSMTSVLLKGSGDVEVDCRDCGRAVCRLLGSGDITLKGSLQHVDRDVKGSGEIDTDEVMR